MSHVEPTLGVGGSSGHGEARTRPLSGDEVWRLTLYKWRYTLEAQGFDEREVRPLLFQKWRVLRSAAAHE